MLLRPFHSLLYPSRPSTLFLSRSLHSRIIRSAPSMLVSDQTIQLTREEDRLCSLLQQFKQHVETTEPDSPQVECRIAGGWVRDKLLRLPCNDIDLALSNHYGFPFATAFSTFLKDHHPEIPQTRIAKIESNPEQSKHLETAKQDVMGMELDYVNLRKEGYTEGSRIPSMMEFGTPLDDALRRDITINSLFYNVHTRKVEDWTEKGLSDLEEGIIRTPLPPRSTFDDDPLRIIRCVRFASRYGFTLHQDIVEAVKDEDIKKSLRERISRERVGIEIEKMFGGKNALLSIQLIESLGIYSSIVFFSTASQNTFASTSPSSSSPATPAPSATALSAALILDQILLSTASSLPPIHPTLLPARLKKERTRLFLTAFATPYRGLTVKPGKTVVSAPETVIKEVMKLSGADASFVGRAFQASEALSLPSLDKFPPPTRRSAIGNLLRQIYIHNPVSDTCWTTSIFWSLIMDLLPHFNPESGRFDDAASSVVELYNTFVSEIIALNLPPAIEAKPIIDGKEVLSLLSLTRGGPILKTSLDLIVTWQLDHPEGTKEEGSAWLKEEYEQGRVVAEAPPPPAAKGGAKGAGASGGEKGGKKKKI